MIQQLAGAGFLGSGAPLYSDLSLLLLLLSAGLFSWGWRLATRRQYEAHRWVQTTAAMLNAFVVLSVMIASFASTSCPVSPQGCLKAPMASQRFMPWWGRSD
jgi:uncharacterized membrane protein YozB (DUF420 family)